MLEGSTAKRAERAAGSLLPPLVAAATLAVTFAAFTNRSLPGPVVPAFVPAVMAGVCLLYLLTSFHLLRLYALSGRKRLFALGLAFSATGSLAIPHLLTFPGAIPALAAQPDFVASSAWFWLLWHLTFPLGLLTATFISDAERLGKPAVVHRRSRRAWLWTSLLPLAILAASALVIATVPSLPDIMVGLDFTPLHTQIEAPLLAIDAACLVVAGWRVRAGTSLDRWLAVCLLFTLCDVLLTLSVLHLYALGWYVAYLLSAGASSVLLIALLADFTRIYGNLALGHDALAQAASTDPLTRLHNRAASLARASALLSAGSPFCLGIMDIDHFKQVNDTYGHLAGDDILRAVATRTTRTLKAQDTVGRLGGEEFLLLLPGLPLAQAEIVVNRTLSTLRAQPFATRVGPIPLTASMGLAAASPGEPIEHLLGRADAALYAAKHAGRDRLALADGSP